MWKVGSSFFQMLIFCTSWMFCVCFDIILTSDLSGLLGFGPLQASVSSCTAGLEMRQEQGAGPGREFSRRRRQSRIALHRAGGHSTGCCIFCCCQNTSPVGGFNSSHCFSYCLYVSQLARLPSSRMLLARICFLAHLVSQQNLALQVKGSGSPSCCCWLLGPFRLVKARH